MSSEFGRILRVTLFGESHGPAVGVIMDNLPAGETVDEEEINRFLGRRKAQGPLSTSRREEDRPLFLSGLVNGKTCGSPLCAYIENRNVRSEDYEAMRNIPRPSHADYAAHRKWNGAADLRGGGHFSGRLTAPLCIAGSIAKQILARQNIFVGAHLLSIAKETDDTFPHIPTKELFAAVAAKTFPVLDDRVGQRMQDVIQKAADEEDSVGGVIECAALGVPAGLGSPLFDGMENRLASAIFGIPAVKGIEFGAGFGGTKLKGSEHNDALLLDEEQRIVTQTNRAGGINGGITNGMPLVFSVAIKPTPSIGRMQRSVDLVKRQETELRIKGRHDPCVAHRAVPVVEAVTALVLLDVVLEEKYGNQ